METHKTNDETIKHKSYPNLWQSWILVLALLIPFSFISLFASSILKYFNVDKNWITLICYAITFGLVVFLGIVMKMKHGIAPIIRYKAKISPLFYLLLIPALFGLAISVQTLGDLILPAMPESFKKIYEAAINFSFPSVFLVVVLAPVLEELFCRGIICEGLSKTSTKIRAIVWSAIIFAVIHLNPWQGLSAFAIGCFFAWIYLHTKSIVPCIFLHFTNNAMSLIANYVNRNRFEINTPTSEIVGASNISIILGGALVFAGCFYLLSKFKFESE